MNDNIVSNKALMENHLGELKETHDLDLKETYETIRKNVETIINKIQKQETNLKSRIDS